MAGPGLFGTLAAGYGAVSQGRRAGEERRRAELLGNYALQLQQEKERRAAAEGERDYGLRARQVGVQERTASAAEDANRWRRENPPPRNIDPRSPEGLAAQREIADINARAQAKYRAPRAEPRTAPESASARDLRFQRAADQAIQAAGGDPRRAAQLLVDNPVTRNIFSEGMGSMHLNAAAARYQASKRGPTAGAPALDTWDGRIDALPGPSAAPFTPGPVGPPPPPASNAAPVTPGSTGPINLAAPAAGPKPVPAADAERARTDPGFAAWLRGRGYAVPE